MFHAIMAMELLNEIGNVMKESEGGETWESIKAKGSRVFFLLLLFISLSLSYFLCFNSQISFVINSFASYISIACEQFLIFPSPIKYIFMYTETFFFFVHIFSYYCMLPGIKELLTHTQTREWVPSMRRFKLIFNFFLPISRVLKWIWWWRWWWYF
jgi:hypothetical protein